MKGYRQGMRAAMAGLVALLCGTAAFPSAPVLAAAPKSAPAEPQAPLVTPDTVLASNVSSYTLANPKLFWTEFSMVSCDPDLQSKTVRDQIKRIAIQSSPKRTLFDQTTVNGTCSSLLSSNMVADNDFVYWTTQTGLWKLSTDAITQTSPLTMTTAVAGSAELALTSDAVYALTPSGGIRKTLKATGASSVFVSAGNVGTNPSNFQTDGAYLYWITGGTLKRFQISGGSVTQIGGAGVTGYIPIFNLCIIGPCTNTTPNGVFVGVGDVLSRYNILTGAFMSTLYTSSDAQAVIREVGVQNDKLVVLEDRVAGPANPFIPLASYLITKNSDGSGSPSVIYQSPGTSIGNGPSGSLRMHDEHAYWLEGGTIFRLSQNAAALPQTNMRITSIEVTQGIQDLSNTVRLISGKRTVVRMHVQSDGPSVPGVTAQLTLLNPSFQPVGAPLIPSNKTGEFMTVLSNPHRNVLDESFYFELPMDWVSGNFLNLRGDLNPYHYPSQASYANNTAMVVKFLSPSPRLEMNFVLFDYDYNGSNIAAQYQRDYLPTLSWLHRAYPISDRQDNIENSGPGLHTHYFYVHDQALRSHLDYTSNDCPSSPDDDAGLCASDYINSYLEDIDDEDNNSASYYGFMPSFTDKYNNKWFARGQTDGDTSNGPADAPKATSWDTDGTIADWYAAHEIGHQLGRSHPKPAGDPDVSDKVKVGCGHSDDDGSYPYPGARIGTGSLMGFDLGDTGVNSNLIMQPLDNQTWKDVMSYCPNQWISDYTYEAIYNNLGPASANAMLMSAQKHALGSDALSDVLRVKGVISTGSQSVVFTKVQHKQDLLTAQIAGDYRLRAYDAANVLLSTTVFTPSQGADTPGVSSFAFNILYPAGVRKIDVLHVPSNKVLGSYAISPNAPVISNVHLVGAPSPVTGTVQLAWDASDADGGALKFDVYYSRDNGQHFVPVELGVQSNTATINSLNLGGSSQALFKVKASDGVNSATANSPAFTMANKAPSVQILNPAGGASYHYGQVVNFSALAEDLQTNGIPDGGLTWRNQYGALGTGAELSVLDLPVGVNYITVTAQSTTSLQSSASITVEVTDDLDAPTRDLIAGPANVGWHFDAGATAAQTATIFIDNNGSGPLAWQLANSAPWLTADVISGTTASTVTLTANPTLFGGDIDVATVVHITASGQERLIRVSAQVGNNFDPLGAPAKPSQDKSRIYLPVLHRGA